MKYKLLPYTIEHLITSKQHKENIRIFNENTILNSFLIQNNYLKLAEEQPNPSFKYKYYIATDIFLNKTVNDILMEMADLTLEEYKKVRFIAFKDLHVDSKKQFIELIDRLIDTDALYHGGILLESQELTSILIMHSLAGRSGLNKEKTYGEPALEIFVKEHSYESLFKKLTGKGFSDFEDYLHRQHKREDIKTLKKLAKKHGYILTKR